jgi:predicted membrane metal-binding protein
MGAHEDFHRSHHIQGASNRAFGFTFAVVFAIVALWPLIHRGAPRIWAVALSAGFLAITLVNPSLLAPLNRVWTRIGILLNRVVSPVVTALIFFLVVTPMAVLARWSGKDFLRLRFDAGAESYWIHRQPPGPEPQSMADQF